MSILYARSIGTSNTSEALRINEDGTPIFSSRIGFCVATTSSVSYVNDQTIVFNKLLSTNPGSDSSELYIKTNISYINHYNTSTGVFTAPVAGLYYFESNILKLNDATSSLDVRLKHNGSIKAAGYSGDSFANYFHQLSINLYISLEANDTISMHSQGSNSVYGDPTTGANHSHFLGFLVQ